MTETESEGGRRRGGDEVESRVSQLQDSAGHCTQSTCSRGEEEGEDCHEASSERVGEWWKVGWGERREDTLSDGCVAVACDDKHFS